MVKSASIYDCDKMASNSNLRLLVGDKFESLVELESAIISFEKSHFVSLHKRDAKTLETMKKHAPNREEAAKSELLYYGLKYCCKYGGKKLKKQGTDKRITQ